MPCFTPIAGYRKSGGGVAFTSREGFIDRPIYLRCGQCRGCRLERSRHWALRCVHEASLHERNCFLTLTYDREHVPADGSLNVRDWQLFAKRVRKRLGPFRFLHCGEYGDESFRPHYHACVFGLDFGRDRMLWKEPSTFVSPELEELWGKGFATLGHLTWQSAAYVARYVMKKATGPLARERYRRIDGDTGEEFYVRPEYVTMSRRPGLASEWFARFRRDVFPDDFVVHAGKRHGVPRYYDRLLERDDPELFASLKAGRVARAFAARDESTPERLRVREAVADARLSLLRRDGV